MREQGYGHILSTSSNSAFGIGANAPYSVTKAGLLGLTLVDAIEGKPHGILVNAMMPAFSRMSEAFPFGDGAVPFLDQDSVVGSGQK